jgi:hypothetical protein
MDLPNMNQTHKVEKPKPPSTSPPQLQPNRLWSKVVGTTKSSLLYDTKSKDATSGLTTLKSLVFRQGRSPGSVFFDVTSRPETQTEFFGLIAKQLPKRYAVGFCKESGNRRLIEVNFLDDTEALNEALRKGLMFEKDNVCILPTAAKNKEINAIRVAVSNLPFISELEVMTGLRNTFAPYGIVLDVGIEREKDFNTFVGQGYVVIDNSHEETHPPFAALDHNLSWCNSKASGIHATWHNMPPWCTYCHDSSGKHTARTCPERPSHQKIVCWNCHEIGHYKTECPAKKLRKSLLDHTGSPNQERLRKEKAHSAKETAKAQMDRSKDAESMSEPLPGTSQTMDTDDGIKDGHVQENKQIHPESGIEANPEDSHAMDSEDETMDENGKDIAETNINHEHQGIINVEDHQGDETQDSTMTEDADPQHHNEATRDSSQESSILIEDEARREHPPTPTLQPRFTRNSHPSEANDGSKEYYKYADDTKFQKFRRVLQEDVENKIDEGTDADLRQ